MLVRCLSIASMCAVLLVSPVQAHHSHGNYDTTKWTTMEGKVTELHLLVPHSCYTSKSRTKRVRRQSGLSRRRATADSNASASSATMSNLATA
jgi:hypothetical protein